MSRIEDALRRARASEKRDDTGTLRPELHAVDAHVVPSWQLDRLPAEDDAGDVPLVRVDGAPPAPPALVPAAPAPAVSGRSEERRVGKECRARWEAGEGEKERGAVGGRSREGNADTKKETED